MPIILRLLLMTALLASPLARAACPPAKGPSAKPAAGLCASVISSGLAMPRGLAVLDDGSLLVTEMVRWDAANGRLIQLKAGKDGWEKTLIATGFDRPHGVMRGPDGKIYVGEVGRIVRFALNNPTQRETVISLPIRQRHPLSTFALSPDGDLYVNVGSSSDNCDQASPAQQRAGFCPEAEGDNPVGVVRRYHIADDGKISDLGIFARGLRNSMALGVNAQSGLVLQAENSRDAIQLKLGLPNDNELPHDELNILQAGKHYGWPYCYDNRLSAPEFPAYDCRKTVAPYMLLPAHSAPLGLAWWQGELAPARFRNWLVVGYHGYRQHGHRLMAWPVDKQGLPKGKPVELLGQWKDAKGPGGPVEIRVGPDGALYLTDDRHGQVIRVYTP
ncbi:PQQ-dependent sugar dehydrogenase [uncultured Aquitalea sp.]|uniref:PQQ-dependent sugar dehydrogenase n=1 Tax=uncultured Aquitalea sp. TaxID=540272 RepID=UPI0025FC6730|nr:PQQ-dependent sugar dehydrogenase [uncultured Aquitalea sp.]